MSTVNKSPEVRRGFIGALLALGATSAVQASRPADLVRAKPEGPSVEEITRYRLRELRTPNVHLVDQDGRSVRFFDDIAKGKRLIVNVMYTVCSNVCTPATRNLIEARELLGRDASDLHFVSLTLTPLSDTPEALRAYKKQFGIGPDWTFLTGKLDQVEKLQRAMGFISDREGDDLLSHSTMARLCDERLLRWSHVNTMHSPRTIARMIRFENV